MVKKIKIRQSAAKHLEEDESSTTIMYWQVPGNASAIYYYIV